MRKAVTIIELAVSIVIIGILMVGFGSYLVQVMDVWNFLSFRNEVVNQARVGMVRMGGDIRRLTSIEQANNTSLQFLIPDAANSTRLRYQYVNQQIILDEDADNDTFFGGVGDLSNPLVDGVSSFAFSCFAQNGTATFVPADIYRIEMNLTVSDGGESMRVEYGIFPRNFKFN